MFFTRPLGLNSPKFALPMFSHRKKNVVTEGVFTSKNGDVNHIDQAVVVNHIDHAVDVNQIDHSQTDSH